MSKLARHKEVIYRLVRDERLSPNRRILAEMLMLWIDETDLDMKERLLKIIEAQFGTPKIIKWDGPEKQSDTHGKEAEQSLKDYFSMAQENNEVSEPDVLVSDK
jgi:hypothetical protein